MSTNKRETHRGSLGQRARSITSIGRQAVVRFFERSPTTTSVAIIAALTTVLIVLDVVFRPSPKDLLVEAHGLLFDLVLFGGLLLAIDRWRSKRERSTRHLEELNDIRTWQEPEAAYRIAGLVRRLRDDGVTISDLEGVYLANANLSGLALSETNLTGANLEGSNLSHAVFFKVDLRGANLRHAHVGGAYFNQILCQHADLTGVDFRDATLLSVDFAGATLVGVNFADKNLNGMCFDGAVLSGANLRGAALNKCGKIVDLSGADLSRSHLGRINLADAKLRGILLDGAWLYDFEDIAGWADIGSIRNANVHEVRNWEVGRPSPFQLDRPMRASAAVENVQRFYDWAMANGAVDMPWKEWRAYAEVIGAAGRVG